MASLTSTGTRQISLVAAKLAPMFLLILGARVQAADGPAQSQPTSRSTIKSPYQLLLEPVGKQKSWSGRKNGVVEFFHNGFAAADGSDIVVKDKSGRLAHRILQAGPGTFLRVAFAFTDVATVRIDFGSATPATTVNKRMKTALPVRPASSTWTPQAGLLLTTYPLPAGANANSWQRMQKTVAAARKLGMYGSDFVARVYHGYHHFSAAGKFVSVYQGWLGCPQDGDYIFATSSDDASFMLIDNKMVISWPGGHGAVWDARHKKKVRLKRGVHLFNYYHLNFGGPTIACAAWKAPGAKKIWPIDAKSFAPVVHFGPRAIVNSGSPTPRAQQPLVHWHNLGETWLNNRQLLRFGFSCSLAGADAKQVNWDFGDGCSTVGARVEHVYLTPGPRTIRCSIGKQSIANTMMIQPDYSRKISRRVDKPKAYIIAISKYPFARLTSRDLFQAIQVLGDLPKEQAAFTIASRVMLARKEVDARSCYLVTKLFCDRLRSQMHRPGEAVRLYRLAISRKDMGRTRRAHLIREVGDTFFYFLKDNQNALNEYDKVVGRYAAVLEANIVRVTKIKIGDIFRQRGDGTKARKLYQEADRMKLFTRNFAQNTVRKGALYKTVDDYLRRGQTEAALKWLEILEWEYPLQKLDGYSSIARARIAEKQKKPTEAIKQLLWFVKASPRSSYAAEAFYNIARLYQQAGHKNEVERIAKKLGTDYAESPYSVKVKELEKQ